MRCIGWGSAGIARLMSLWNIMQSHKMGQTIDGSILLILQSMTIKFMSQHAGISTLCMRSCVGRLLNIKYAVWSRQS